MKLNFTFENWCQACQLDRKISIEAIAVHEFGHALGLSHEHNRSDTPDTCHAAPQGTDGDQAIGEWDSQSVMNRCNEVFMNEGTLSDGDIAGLLFLYQE